MYDIIVTVEKLLLPKRYEYTAVMLLSKWVKD